MASSSPRVSAFPRPIGRGLIEAIRSRWTLAHHPGCRDRSVAASLKPGRELDAPGVLHVFPRPIGRGLIEAGTVRMLTGSLTTFPRPIGRGLIEAWNSIGR